MPQNQEETYMIRKYGDIILRKLYYNVKTDIRYKDINDYSAELQ